MQVIDDSFDILDDNNFIFYQGFLTQEAAEDYKTMFDEYAIHCILEETKNYGERVILGSVNNFPFILKVLKSDFDKIPDAIKISINKMPNSYFNNHPLNSLNSNELKTIVEKFSDNAYEELFTSIKILENRGIQFDEEKIDSIINSTAKEEKVGRNIHISKLIITFLIMIFGVFISWLAVLICALIFANYCFGKSHNKSGIKIMTYDMETRKLSLILLIVGLFINIATIIFFYNYHFESFIRFLNTPFLSN